MSQGNEERPQESDFPFDEFTNNLGVQSGEHPPACPGNCWAACLCFKHRCRRAAQAAHKRLVNERPPEKLDSA
jgi:hypothetical protein